MKRKINIALFTLCLVGLFVATLPGCATPAKIAYSTLASIGVAENGAMTVAATAYAKGQITQAQWNQIADAHGKFLPAYDTACSAAAVTLDQATVPANVTTLETDVITLVAAFVQPTK